MIGITNKTLLLHLVGVYIIYDFDFSPPYRYKETPCVLLGGLLNHCDIKNKMSFNILNCPKQNLF